METRIYSRLKGNKILVNAKFLENGKTIHEINHAFAYDETPKRIRKEVEKAKNLFIQEREQAKHQKKIDEKHEKAKETVNKLNKV